MTVKNKVQLITYPDSLGGDLKSLANVLDHYFPDLFQGGIHILPPFPSSGDRGFAPINYFEIESKFGTWEDVKKLSANYDVLLDVMVNHVSRHSLYFNDFLKNGKNSPYADIFLTLDKIWDDGIPKQEDIDMMFLRREVPYSTYKTEQGTAETVWTTFGKTTPSEQIDLDINAPLVKQILTDIFTHFKNNGVKIVRLDAVGYIVKKIGTSCFFVEPDIYPFLDWIKELADNLEIDLLPEVHAHYSIQNKLSEHGFWIYDFILPYRILDTILGKDATQLIDYIKNRSPKQFTMLDCHDGIPLKPDLDEIIDTKRAREVVNICLERGANLSLIVSEEHKSEDGFDVHQIRCSYYSMVQSDDAYLAARAIQLFVPGIPQIYYVGLLAGENDTAKVSETGEGREINRHNFSVEEIKDAVSKEVTQRLISLIRFRNEHHAFDGQFKVVDSLSTEVNLRWDNKEHYAELNINLATFKTKIIYSDIDGNETTIKV